MFSHVKLRSIVAGMPGEWQNATVVYAAGSDLVSVEDRIRTVQKRLREGLDYLTLDLDKGNPTWHTYMSDAVTLASLMGERNALLAELKRNGIDIAHGARDHGPKNPRSGEGEIGD